MRKNLAEPWKTKGRKLMRPWVRRKPPRDAGIYREAAQIGGFGWGINELMRYSFISR
jgi:hypothetical protein